MVAFLYEVCACAVDYDITAAFDASDGVGLESGSIGDVPDGDLLAINDVDEVHQVGRLEDASDEVDVCARNSCAVDFS